MTRRRQVVVIGSGDDREHDATAFEIGRFIASRGWVLVSGGRGGVMEAASRGASEAGGLVIGILPGTDFGDANRYCDIVIPTGIGYARNIINVLAGDAIVSIGGKAGTLSEIAHAWQHGRPLICCQFTGGWSNRIEGAPVDDRGGVILHARSAGEACELLEQVLGRQLT